MPVPKRRTTRSRRDMRRSHLALTTTASQTTVTGSTHRRHFISSDGLYRGKVIFTKNKSGN